MSCAVERVEAGGHSASFESGDGWLGGAHLLSELRLCQPEPFPLGSNPRSQLESVLGILVAAAGGAQWLTQGPRPLDMLFVSPPPLSDEFAGASDEPARVWIRADGSVPDSQLAALLMAIVLRGMNRDETAGMTVAMADSGERLELWCTVPGHRTAGMEGTLDVAP